MNVAEVRQCDMDIPMSSAGDCESDDQGQAEAMRNKEVAARPPRQLLTSQKIMHLFHEAAVMKCMLQYQKAQVAAGRKCLPDLGSN